MNLIINARDAMPDGGTIAVTGEQRARPSRPIRSAFRAGDYVVLAVADTGCGIAAEMLEQVTEPFFTTKDVGKGTGLGLSMVYGFAHQSGGAIDIDSQVGEGTRVEIWLPRAPEPSGRRRRAGAGRGRTRPADAPARCASCWSTIIDGVRETTAGMLERHGPCGRIAPATARPAPQARARRRPLTT